MATHDAPWYRQPWPWFLIALPAVVVLASFATLFIALDNPHSLVRDDWYKDGLAINRHLAQHEYARARGISAVLRIDAAGTLELDLAGPEAPARLRLVLVHPTDASRDRTIELSATGAERYAGQLPGPLEGRRYLQLEAVEGDSPWRLGGAIDTPPPATVALRPDAR